MWPGSWACITSRFSGTSLPGRFQCRRSLRSAAAASAPGPRKMLRKSGKFCPPSRTAERPGTRRCRRSKRHRQECLCHTRKGKAQKRSNKPQPTGTPGVSSTERALTEVHLLRGRQTMAGIQGKYSSSRAQGSGRSVHASTKTQSSPRKHPNPKKPKKRERLPSSLRFTETKRGKTTVRRYSGRTFYRFEEVQGKLVDFDEIFTA